MIPRATARYLHENTDKPHRCPHCHCVMPYRYRRVRRWLYEAKDNAYLTLRYGKGIPRWVGRVISLPFRPDYDRWFPRACAMCGVIAVPAWLSRLVGITED